MCPRSICSESADESRRIQNRYDAEARADVGLGKGKAKGMWVDKYRPKKFSDLLGEDVSRDSERLVLSFSGAG